MNFQTRLRKLSTVLSFILSPFHCPVYLFSLFDQFFFCLASFKMRVVKTRQNARARGVPGTYPARIEKIRARSGSGQLCVTCGSVPGSPKPGPDPDFCHPYSKLIRFTTLLIVVPFKSPTSFALLKLTIQILSCM